MASVKKPGRKPVGRVNRIELRRRKASTTLRVQDRHIVLLHKLASRRRSSLSEALEFALDETCGQVGITVRTSKTSELGWQ